MTQEIIVLIDSVLRYLSPSEPALQKAGCCAKAKIFPSSMSVPFPEMLSTFVWNPHYLKIFIAELDAFNLCVESTLLEDIHCGGIHRGTNNQRKNDKRESDGDKSQGDALHSFLVELHSFLVELQPFLVELQPFLDRVSVSPFLVELHPCLDHVQITHFRIQLGRK
jgi:hypothetical protein